MYAIRSYYVYFIASFQVVERLTLFIVMALAAGQLVFFNVFLVGKLDNRLGVLGIGCGVHGNDTGSACGCRSSFRLCRGRLFLFLFFCRSGCRFFLVFGFCSSYNFV